VSLARDLAHSRPHLDHSKDPKNAIEQFTTRFHKNIKSIAHITTDGLAAVQLAADARSMPLLSDSIDLIVTSPPYANAIDYMRAHKFSLVWFHESVKTLSQLRAQYIGSERTIGAKDIPLPQGVEGIIRQLAQCDTSKAAILRKYFVEMHAVMAEMYRVLRSDCAAIIVVGPSIMRGIDVPTHHCLAEIAHTIGFSVVGVVQRLLDRNKRMMPARFGMKTNLMIEQRMHEEYVIGLLKPPTRS
jgi:DNA modification methylase